jgi:hypothetical protein
MKSLFILGLALIMCSSHSSLITKNERKLASEDVISFGNVYDYGKIFISNDMFDNTSDIKKFCEKNNGKYLDDNTVQELILTFAMGARSGKMKFFSKMERELDSRTSGIGFWQVESNRILFWYNGRGFEMGEFTHKELKNKYPNVEVDFPAICKEN